MSTPSASGSTTSATTVAPSSSPPSPFAPPPPKVNPAFKYLGLPNFRPKLPSKGWLIFIGITTTWAALVIHDRRKKRQNIEKWCTRVSHLAEQPLPANQLPRKIRIYLAAPPGDGVTAAREYFKEYVKPVLVAAALDYEVIEGRRGGETRYAVAESVRQWRRRHGEKDVMPEGQEQVLEEEPDTLEEMRKNLGVTREVEDEEGGVMVVGRHTWKEFIRGVHEGWLGPIKSPVVLEPPAQTSPSPNAPKPRPPIPPPTILPEEYHHAPLPPSFPHASTSLPLCSPVTIIPFPHLLGFLNTPIRIYRYLNQRHLADKVGREAAAICLGFSRPFHAFLPEPLADGKIDPNVIRSVDGKVNDGDGGHGGEIDQGCYPEEENDWDKKYRTLPDPEPERESREDIKDGEGKEVKVEEPSEGERYKMAVRRDAREWAPDIVVDGRIVGRMRRYDLAVVPNS